MPQATRRWISDKAQSLRGSDVLPCHDILDAGMGSREIVLTPFPVVTPFPVGLAFVVMVLVSPSMASASGENASRGTKSPSYYAEVARKVVTYVNSEDYVSLRRLFSDNLRESMSESRSRDFVRRVANGGKISRVGPPKLINSTGYFSVSAEWVEWQLEITLTPEGFIDGIYINPIGPRLPTPERNKTPMRLPFRGSWRVVWGGTTPEQNHHIDSTNDAKCAIDFDVTDDSGRHFRGDGRRNEDYFAYSKEVLAVAAGTVVTVVDGVPDNRPRSEDPTTSGNEVIVQHAEHEFSVYLHLRPYKTRVRVGDRVRAGQVLGLCGNSGASNVPHLHFHLVNTSINQDGTGFPVYFNSVYLTRSGKKVTARDYSPIRDNIIEQYYEGPQRDRSGSREGGQN